MSISHWFHVTLNYPLDAAVSDGRKETTNDRSNMRRRISGQCVLCYLKTIERHYTAAWAEMERIGTHLFPRRSLPFDLIDDSRFSKISVRSRSLNTKSCQYMDQRKVPYCSQRELFTLSRYLIEPRLMHIDPSLKSGIFICTEGERRTFIPPNFLLVLLLELNKWIDGSGGCIIGELSISSDDSYVTDEQFLWHVHSPSCNFKSNSS